MRRVLHLLLLAALAAATLGFQTADADGALPTICVRLRDWQVPVAGVTVERPQDQVCAGVTLHPVDGSDEERA